MLYIVTGGAGFIGSNIVAEIEKRALGPVVVVDDLGHAEKWRNIAKRTCIYGIVSPSDFSGFLMGLKPGKASIIHMGARTSTRDTDAAALARNNAMLTSTLFRLSHERRWPFVYASSAQVYGTSRDFSDADETPLRPITAYGWSKAVADQMIIRLAAERTAPPIWAGLRFFNVYGPCEDHKADDRSFVSKCFEMVRSEERLIRVFRGSDNFQRDWVHVEDCAKLAVDIASGVLPAQGIFNVGTGRAESFIRVAEACIIAANRKAALRWVDFPPDLNGHYQSYTCADMSKLLSISPSHVFKPLADGARDLWVRSAALDGMDRFP